ncbi:MULTISPECIES: CPBP family intramembrane glutamic endopeptidase [unclassified Microbacterium]|uniref:CPBP family intramembrane glutamic endopeptidase n=1 Tax=unclassified Microbacterium TaxID=2609290 RepID=UPI00097EB492|nr:type II CAAX endopeptidase family protein [Microbacterium sp. JB110]RCS59141.1 CPBP family intramembrane metalloprotease [Microbacterium sp. JB110]SJM69008.1 CAAX amino terminal protease family protein [Frigoribacterium sp. JB110]
MNASDLYSPLDVREGVPPQRVPWGPVACYLLIAFGLGWLVCLPLWLGDGLASPLFGVLVPALMFTPTVAALIMTFTTVRKGARARWLGLLPFRPVARKIWLFLLLPVAFLVIGFAASLLAIGLGWATPDLALAGAAALLPPEVPVEMYLVGQFVSLPIVVVIATASAFGEELGWRGYLATALSPLGFWRSALVSGIVWGLWHAPIILLGYNFARTDALGLAYMCAFCLVAGVIVQWTRYFTRSVWPAALAHGALNAAFPMSLMILDPEGTEAVAGTVMGVPGWIMMAVAIGLLLLARGFRPGPDRAMPGASAETQADRPSPETNAPTA